MQLLTPHSLELVYPHLGVLAVAEQVAVVMAVQLMELQEHLTLVEAAEVVSMEVPLLQMVQQVDQV
jgi:hypothetical protein